MTRRIRIQRAVLRTGRLLQEMRITQFTQVLPAGAWQPPINLYRFPGHYELVVELAGVEPANLAVELREPNLIHVSGYRSWPEWRREPPGTGYRTTVLEIEYGEFSRDVVLSPEDHVTTLQVEHTNGLVWIRAELRKPIVTHGTAGDIGAQYD